MPFTNIVVGSFLPKCLKSECEYGLNGILWDEDRNEKLNPSPIYQTTLFSFPAPFLCMCETELGSR